MRKKIREIICALIPDKTARSKVRHYLGALRLWLDIKNAIAFTFSHISPNTVLIIEPNECHAECLCSYLKYFKETGYNTHLITTSTNLEMHPLYYLPSKYAPQEIFQFSPQQFKILFKAEKLKKYSHIFLCSTHNYFFEKSNIEALNISQDLQNKMIIMEHDLRQIKSYNEDDFLNSDRLCAITNFEQNPQIKVISPHYFPSAKPTQKHLSITNFISVGALDIKRRNVSILFDAVKKLSQEGIKNFKITIIGGGSINNIPADITDFFDIKSRLSFPDMYKELNNSDFILPLLDPTIKGNRDYLQFLTTGTKQLILGFQKPCIINKEFAKALGFDKTNSLIYNDNEIYEQMKNAILLKEDTYIELINALSQNAEVLDKQSLINLKEALKNV